MPGRHSVQVEYHPEFLYFNELVRRCEFTPEAHPEVWQSPNPDRMSPFGVFEWILTNIELRKGAKPVSELVSTIWPLLEVPIAPLQIDPQPWMEFAYGINFEKMVARYSATIFGFLGTSFELPSMKVSPVRLTPLRRPKMFRTLFRGSYSFEHILRADPACYRAEGNWIFMPIPETKRELPVGLYDELVIHEIFHSPFRAMGGFGFAFPNFLGYIRPASQWQFHVFGELLANHGSIAVLYKEKTFSKSDKHAVLKRVVTSRAPAACEAAATALMAMARIPFKQWGEILNPVFGVYRKASFLMKERKRTDVISGKALRGILRKKYGYTKQVRGMGDKQARKEVQRRSNARLTAVLQQVRELDILRLLRQAHVSEKNKTRQEALETLIAVFDDDMKPQWANLLASP